MPGDAAAPSITARCLRLPLPGDPSRSARVYLAEAKAGRAAVAACLQAAGDDLGLDGAASIAEHSRLAAAPRQVASASHTGDWGAVVISDAPGVCEIGIDMEFSDRRIGRPRQLADKLINGGDDAGCTDDILRTWVCKEAIFKAVDPVWRKHRNGPLVVSGLWLRGKTFGVTGSDQALGAVTCQRVAAGDRELLLALAVLREIEFV